MDSNTGVPLFLLQNFGLKGVLIFLIVGSALIIYVSIKAIKNKKITYSGGKSTGKSAVVIGALFLITTIVILIAVFATFF